MSSSLFSWFSRKYSSSFSRAASRSSVTTSSVDVSSLTADCAASSSVLAVSSLVVCHTVGTAFGKSVSHTPQAQPHTHAPNLRNRTRSDLAVDNSCTCASSSATRLPALASAAVALSCSLRSCTSSDSLAATTACCEETHPITKRVSHC